MNIPLSLDSHIESQRYSDFVTFTSTLYKDDTEGKVRSEAFFSLLDNAEKMGARVVVGDGGSGQDFLQRVNQYKNVILVSSGKGGENSDLTMGGERRYAGAVAMRSFPDAKYFLWLEPEKVELMSEGNIDAILNPMREGVADMVVPSRKTKDTLPPQQKAAENRANKRVGSVLRDGRLSTILEFKNMQSMDIWEHRQNTAHIDKRYSDNKGTLGESQYDAPYDLWFGPKAFTRKSMEQDFLSYKGTKWDSIITSVVLGILDGKKVVDVPVEFTYPPEQTALELDSTEAEKYQKKRRSQYRYIIKTVRDVVKLQAHGGLMQQVSRYLEQSNSGGLIRITNSFGMQFGHEDARRLIEEYNGTDFSVQRFTIKMDNVPLGNHFHTKGKGGVSEIFILELGGGKLVTQDIDTFGSKQGGVEVREIKSGDIIVIPPNQAHTFFLNSGSIMRGIRPYPFNNNDKDLNAYVLELPK